MFHTTITQLVRPFPLALILTLFFAACTPKAGDPGPKGDIGTTGATGATGAVGATGPAGPTGTANVIYSAWTSVTFTGSGTSYMGTLTAPKITQEVLDKADIRVYWSESGRVISLPYSEVVGTTTYTVHQRFYVGRVELKSSYALNPQQFRYIIIPGGVASGRKAAIDLNDYAAVKAFYNLPD